VPPIKIGIRTPKRNYLKHLLCCTVIYAYEGTYKCTFCGANGVTFITALGTAHK
jgi:hypothetical protein